MPLEVQLHTGDVRLGDEQERRIRHHLETIEKRLANFQEPVAKVTLRAHEAQRRITVDLQIVTSPKTEELISHQQAETPEHAVRLAVEDVERQLERRYSALRGESTYGVPSRRLPKQLRPHPLPEKE
jgi:ribosome-associated translation inhibitor RaiA